MALTFQDVERLAAANAPRERINIATKVSEGFARRALDGRQKDIAIEIFRLLVRDAEVKVREALSLTLRSSIDLPRDIVLRLAQDEDSVAIHMLEFSPVLEEEDLLALIRASRRTARSAAIARRKYVPMPVSEALLEVTDPVVAADLFINPGAMIDEPLLLLAIERLADQESVIDALVERGNLPVSCIEKIFTTVSVQMKRRLASRFNMSRHLLEGRMEYAREWATLGATVRAEEENVESLVRRLLAERKLTSAIVVRSLCMGDLRFFEHAMAALAGLPVENARQLLMDKGELGFQAIYRQSPLPPSYYPAVKKLLDVTFDASQRGVTTPEDFSKRVVDGIISGGYDKSVQYMPLLLAIIQGSASELASVH